MEALTLTRQDYMEGLERIEQIVSETGKSYLDQFSIEFPDGINTASALEICRLMQDPDFDAKLRIMRICITGKIVKVTCPNGDVEKFCINNPEDSVEGFDLFRKEPLALSAIADAVYGHILKKSLRPSKPAEPAAE